MASGARPAGQKALTPINARVVNNPLLRETVQEGATPEGILRAQVFLDRAHFSPGQIDATYAANTRKAILAFQAAHGLPQDGLIRRAMWGLLVNGPGPPLFTYTITKEDVAGPFAKIPLDMMEKSKLPALDYGSPLEAIAEKFHASPQFLTRLNPGKRFDKAGVEIVVPNVQRAPLGQAAAVVVTRSTRTVAALDAEGKILAQYPATIGSSHDPLPVGTWKIVSVLKNPVFRYNPDLFWDANPEHAKAEIPAGPNNPVGVVWIGLSKEHYGIHGTPEPGAISRTQSHGCIRLTNWDAAELAGMVAPGTPAILRE